MTEGKIILPDTYTLRLACGNCSFSMGLKIPLGITVQMYAKDHNCSNCGCKLMSKEVQPYTSPSLILPYGVRLW